MAMTARGIRLLLGVIPLALAAAACAGTAVYGRAGGAGNTPPSGAISAALRVDWVGGFVTPVMRATRAPLLAIYPDGRVIDEGPQIEIYPPPALPNLQLRRISAADVRRLVDRAVAAGIGTEQDFGQPPIADAPSTRFTIQTAGGVRTTEIPALMEADGSGLTAHQQSARRAVRNLFDDLTDLPATLGSGAVSDSTPYPPTAVAAFAEPWTQTDPGPCPSAQAPRSSPGAGPGISCGGPPARPWPGAALPGEPVGTRGDLSCVTARGAEARALLAAARTAVSTTPWTSGDRQWRVSLRPLLPDESGCAELWAAG
jgi:hypothetical protein